MIEDEFLSGLQEMVEYEYERKPPDGHTLARAVVMLVREQYGGEKIYIRKSTYLGAEQIAAIRRDFNGHNHDDIMDQYQIGRTTLYRLLRRSRNQPGK